MKIVQETEVLTTIDELVDPAHTALLVIDMQNEYCSERGGHAAEVWRAVIPNVQTLLEAARRTGVLVAYTEFIRYSRLGACLVDGPSNYVHRDDPLVPRIQEGTWEVQTTDELAPQPGEFVFLKSRGSAFVGTGLDQTLRARGIRSVILTGIVTGGCVIFTYTDTQMHGYYPVLVPDAVAPAGEGNHALEWMAAYGPAFTTDEIVAIWNRRAAPE